MILVSCLSFSLSLSFLSSSLLKSPSMFGVGSSLAGMAGDWSKGLHHNKGKGKGKKSGGPYWQAYAQPAGASQLC